FILIGVWINLDSLFLLMPNGAKYEAGKWVVVIVGIGKLVDMLFGPSSEIIVLSKYYKFNIILILLLAAIVIISNNLLIPRYGIEGAALGSAFALITFNVAKYIFIYVKYKIQPFEITTLKVLIIAALTLAANQFTFPVGSTIIDIILRSILTTVLFGGLVILAKVSPEANELYRKGLKIFKSS
ncbi:MAG: polysaccharide biosynthesis C-terminal domain-containing protein, partial [bacterium]|nr:polysaccharide biosynthesis C-terminal domain-containing protein [bacterium]